MFGGLRTKLRKLREPRESEVQRVILSLLEQDKNCLLLDLGCDRGSFTQELGKRIGTTQLYGIEIVEESIEQAKQKGISVYKSDLNAPFPIDSESIDVVHAKEILEHLHHTDLFLKEIYRVLIRGGYAVISVPNLAAWHNIFCLLWGWQPFATNVSDEILLGNPLHYRYRAKRYGYRTNRVEGKYPGHLRIPTFRALKELLQYHGFEVEKIAGAGYYPLWGMASRPMSHIDPRHSAYLIVKARKI